MIDITFILVKPHLLLSLCSLFRFLLEFVTDLYIVFERELPFQPTVVHTARLLKLKEQSL